MKLYTQKPGTGDWAEGTGTGAGAKRITAGKGSSTRTCEAVRDKDQHLCEGTSKSTWASASGPPPQPGNVWINMREKSGNMKALLAKGKIRTKENRGRYEKCTFGQATHSPSPGYGYSMAAER